MKCINILYIYNTLICLCKHKRMGMAIANGYSIYIYIYTFIAHTNAHTHIQGVSCKLCKLTNNLTRRELYMRAVCARCVRERHYLYFLGDYRGDELLLYIGVIYLSHSVLYRCDTPCRRWVAIGWDERRRGAPSCYTTLIDILRAARRICIRIYNRQLLFVWRFLCIYFLFLHRTCCILCTKLTAKRLCRIKGDIYI